MPRPVVNTITFSIDGREVESPENLMLVDAAKYGDVEIPVFCYEPKIGGPVGACRMCLVEIEGIPKLQAGCATPVKDGMVVHTQTDRVKAAQESIVEFLLINHPLDCPVCDKGGECPLQDISFGWGRGISRMVDPKRHFEKPLALSPLIAIDRERCILCYRCVRFSQEVSEDYQLVFQERGAHTFVGTFDGHPYVAPFSGNIIELCPVGALTSQPYRFRARPWDIEGSGSVCTLCPSQCNVEFTVRDERVLRVMSRHNDAVDDGWLCDKGRFAYQSVHVDERITQPLISEGGEWHPVGWDQALDAAADALVKAKGRVAALAGGETTNEEGFLLQRLVREALESKDVDSGVSGALPHDLRIALSAPAAQATVADLEWAHAVLVLDCEPIDDMPIVDLRIRKGVRRHKVGLAVASSRPSSLDRNAGLSVRYAPGAGEALLCALDAALAGGNLGGAAAAAGADADQVRDLARMLQSAGKDVVILWGERLVSGPRGANAARALLNIANRLGIDGNHDGAGLLEVPAGTNGRGLREVGCIPGNGRDAAAIAAAGAEGELGALYLLHSDPVLTHPGRATWEAALEKTTTVIAHAAFLTDGLRAHADVIFPAESYAEKEGTLTHPDGRLQRLRPAIARQGDARPEWWVLAEICKRAGLDTGALTGPMVTAQVAGAVPFYAGITLEEIGGDGVRWQERQAVTAYPASGVELPLALEAPVLAASPNGRLRLGTFRSIWAGPEVEVSPALKFLVPRSRVELSPADAQKLNVFEGERVLVAWGSETVEATVALRGGAPEGSAFVETNLLDGPLVEVRKTGLGGQDAHPRSQERRPDGGAR